MKWGQWTTAFIEALTATEDADSFAPHDTVAQVLRNIKTVGSRLFFVGNGGSAAIASHFANDFANAGGIASMCFNDAASLTCIGNDHGYADVFLRPLKMHAREDDILFAISSSGQSESILRAATYASAWNMYVVTLSGFDPQNPLRKLGHVNFYTPSRIYGHVEAAHFCVLHSLLDDLCEV